MTSRPDEPRPDPRGVAARTLSHYSRNADSFWAATRDHDVSSSRAALLSAIEGPAPFVLLDLGCGGGRDLAAFRELGHRAVGVEGCPELAAIARAHSGCEVLEQDLLALHLPEAGLDGIFANASLFHVPSGEVRRVLGDLRRALRPRGVLFCSNPRGDDAEGWNGDRYGVWWSTPSWLALVAERGFEPLGHWYRPEGLPPERQPWLASLWRRAPDRSGA